MTTETHNTHPGDHAPQPLALKSNAVLGPNAQLVERLREWASEPACYEVPPPSLLVDAANEIDRLNAWAVAYYKEMRAALLAEQERSRRAIEGLHWMPRVDGRWDETDVAHAEGFKKAKAEALAALGA
jgi:hypothetical protein